MTFNLGIVFLGGLHINVHMCAISCWWCSVGEGPTELYEIKREVEEVEEEEAYPLISLLLWISDVIYYAVWKIVSCGQFSISIFHSLPFFFTALRVVIAYWVQKKKEKQDIHSFHNSMIFLCSNSSNAEQR